MSRPQAYERECAALRAPPATHAGLKAVSIHRAEISEMVPGRGLIEVTLESCPALLDRVQAPDVCCRDRPARTLPVNEMGHVIELVNHSIARVSTQSFLPKPHYEAIIATQSYCISSYPSIAG